MKKTTRFIALVIAVITLASMAIVPVSAKQSIVKPFTDVSSTAWYAKAVKWAVKKSITSGKTATTFCPNDQVTFQETCAFLYRVCGSPEIPSITMNYELVKLPKAVRAKISSWAKKPVAWALKYGIVYRYELTDKTDATGKLIVPNEPLTRNYVIAFLYRAEKKMNGTPKNGLLISPKFEDFTDRDNANLVKGGDGVKAWKWAITRGIIAGRSNTSLACNDTVKRSEIVMILYRYKVTNAYVSIALKQMGKHYSQSGSGPDTFCEAGLLCYALTATSLAYEPDIGLNFSLQTCSPHLTCIAKSTDYNPMSKLQYGDVIYYWRNPDQRDMVAHSTIFLGKIDLSNVSYKKSNDIYGVLRSADKETVVCLAGFYHEQGVYNDPTTPPLFPYWEAYRFDPYPDN